ncbi:transmembrane protein 223 [Heterodontus francisci]|uniref:transmembrane protein 223 n=1 Tax=Heterodontus francisci TaxID=7792 RepID=UPI00355C6558
MGARNLSMGTRSLVMGSRRLAADAWGLTHRRDITAVSPVGHLGQRVCGTLNGVAGWSRNAGQRVWGSVINPRGLDWSRSWTFLSVSPGTGQAWRTLGFREHHLWSIAKPGHLGHGLGTRPLGTMVPQDVLLFRHERERFFRLLGLFCAAQFLFWIYLAHFAFTSLKDTGYEETVLVGDRASNLPTIGGVSLNLGSNKWRFGFTTSCLTVGCLILTAGYIFARRSVHSVLLHRGGQQVTLSSYLPLGGTSSFVVPLCDVSCVAHRSQVPSVIPVKVKGHHFYYLLDKQGQFYNAKLFDITVGAYRKL